MLAGAADGNLLSYTQWNGDMVVRLDTSYQVQLPLLVLGTPEGFKEGLFWIDRDHNFRGYI